MAKGFVHTFYKREAWLNEIEEGEELPGTYATKEDAVAAGCERAIRDKTEHVIHRWTESSGAELLRERPERRRLS